MEIWSEIRRQVPTDAEFGERLQTDPLYTILTRCKAVATLACKIWPRP